jgi:hypothetical protein
MIKEEGRDDDYTHQLAFLDWGNVPIFKCQLPTKPAQCNCVGSRRAIGGPWRNPTAPYADGRSCSGVYRRQYGDAYPTAYNDSQPHRRAAGPDLGGG